MGEVFKYGRRKEAIEVQKHSKCTGGHCSKTNGRSRKEEITLFFKKLIEGPMLRYTTPNLFTIPCPEKGEKTPASITIVKNNAALSRISAMALIVAASVRPSSPDYSRARTTISVTALNLLLRRVP